jgi:hypothetical protein
MPPDTLDLNVLLGTRLPNTGDKGVELESYECQIKEY